MHATNRVKGQRCIPEMSDTRQSEGPKSYDRSCNIVKPNIITKEENMEPKLPKKRKKFMHATEKQKTLKSRFCRVLKKRLKEESSNYR